jgi:cyd operon protein YbgT
MLRGSARNPHGEEAKAMWYFSWMLGIGVALGFGIINVMWLDANGKFVNGHGPGQAGPEHAPSGDSGVQHGEAPRP